MIGFGGLIPSRHVDVGGAAENLHGWDQLDQTLKF